MIKAETPEHGFRVGELLADARRAGLHLRFERGTEGVSIVVPLTKAGEPSITPPIEQGGILNRVKQLRIPQELLLALCRDGFPIGILSTKSLPTDARVIGAEVSWRDVVLTIASSGFPERDPREPMDVIEMVRP